MKRVLQTTALFLLTIGYANASSHSPQLGTLYNRAAKFHGPGRNPVIVIPGILGSNLKDRASGRIVWGGFTHNYASPSSPVGARLFAIPMESGKALSALRDDVVPDGALSRIRLSLLGVPVQLNAYREILLSLGAGGYTDEDLAKAGAINYGPQHFTCFQFDYDWRRENSENAKLLHEFILEKRRYVQNELRRRYGTPDVDVRFDLIAHSMGGLIARYYLEYGAEQLPDDGSVPPLTWAGARYVDRAILVGTPNAGSAKAFEQLIIGVRLAPILPKYSAAVIGTLPSVYELLPRPRHHAIVDAATQTPIDVLDPAIWEKNGWGLADPAQDRELQVLLPEIASASERRAVALNHLRKCLRHTKQFFAALDTPAHPPDGTSLYLMAGDADLMPAIIAIDSHHHVKTIESAAGDGTVVRTSALMDERVGGKWTPELRSPIAWTHTMFFFRNHLGLTKDPAFTDNLLFILLEQQRR